MTMPYCGILYSYSTFHSNERFKCGVSLCALTVKLSAVHISFMRYINVAFYSFDPPLDDNALSSVDAISNEVSFLAL
jgi:hypothetical protein